MWRIWLLILLSIVTELNVQAKNIENQLENIAQQEDQVRAVSQLDDLLEIKSLTNSQRIEILMRQCRRYLGLSDLKKSFAVIQQAKGLLGQNRFSEQHAQVNKLMGIVLYYQGQYEQSLLAYQAALAFYEKQVFSADVAIKQANLLNNIALVQTSLSDTLAALQSYQKADPLYQEYGSEVDKIDVRYNLAILYLSLRRYDLAINMLDEVVRQREALGDDYGVAKAIGDLGVSFKHSGQHKKAQKYTLRALEYFQQFDHQIDVASQLHNIAEVEYELSNIDKAFEYALQGLELSKSMNFQMPHAGSLQTLGKVYFYQGDIENARQHIESSNAIATTMGFQPLINENLALLSLIFAAEHRTKEALDAQLSYQKIHFKLSNEPLNEQIAKFESEQLSQQVKSLQQSKKLQQLQSTKAEQKRLFTILVVALILVVLFFIYRRYLEVRLTKKLENRVKQRTQALEFLTKELQEANLIKGQFLANMSHEIRTPLTAVLGQAEAIIEGEFDDTTIVKEVEVIHNNSLHLLQLVNDILDLSKIEANKFELENRRQDLHTIVDKLRDMFVEQANRKKLSFTITHRLPNPFIIDVDGLRLNQILINLCSNAIKFTKEGWVSLDIEIINKTLLFTVTDTGIGMSPEQMSRVFNIFTQGDNSINRRFSGSGLGLFLSDQLAKVMSGEITVSSQLNQGSTFVLKLPFGEVYPVLESIEPSESTKELISKNIKYSGKILLADDHDDNRRLVTRFLTNLGLEVIQASNGIEAVDLCVKHQPTITLMDIQMPKIDGIQALEELRKLGCTHPIYALTANAMSHEIAQYLSLGFAGHLKKPIEREVFLSTIAQHFDEDIGSGELDDEPVDMSDLITSFINNLVKDKESILQCYNDEKDFESLARKAHKIAGAAGMFGFPELSQSAIELENALKKVDVDESLIDDLIHCLFDEIMLIEHNNTL